MPRNISGSPRHRRKLGAKFGTPRAEEDVALDNFRRDKRSIDGASLCMRRAQQNISVICAKYSRSFQNQSDVIDLPSFEIIKNRGYIESLPDHTPEAVGSTLAFQEPIDPSFSKPPPDYTGTDEPADGEDVDREDDSEPEDDTKEEGAWDTYKRDSTLCTMKGSADSRALTQEFMQEELKRSFFDDFKWIKQESLRPFCKKEFGVDGYYEEGAFACHYRNASAPGSPRKSARITMYSAPNSPKSNSRSGLAAAPNTPSRSNDRIEKVVTMFRRSALRTPPRKRTPVSAKYASHDPDTCDSEFCLICLK